MYGCSAEMELIESVAKADLSVASQSTVVDIARRKAYIPTSEPVCCIESLRRTSKESGGAQVQPKSSSQHACSSPIGKNSISIPFVTSDNPTSSPTVRNINKKTTTWINNNNKMFGRTIFRSIVVLEEVGSTTYSFWDGNAASHRKPFRMGISFLNIAPYSI